MNNYFDEELKYLEKELTYLKTAGMKSSTQLSIITQSINVSVNLQYEPISYPTGSARASALFEVETTHDSIIMPTLDWYYGDIKEAANVYFTTREIRLSQGILTNGNYGIYLYFIGTEQGANSDAARTKNGETVTVSVNLTVSSIGKFTMRRVF